MLNISKLLTFSVPEHEELYPEAEYSDNGRLEMLRVTIDGRQMNLTLRPSIESLVSPHLTTVFRNEDGAGTLDIGRLPASCHYQHLSPEVYAAVSNCDGNIVRHSYYYFIIVQLTNLWTEIITQSFSN